MTPPRLALDDRSRGLLQRFLRDWVAPRWRALIGALGLTALLAAITGLYPIIIKWSFDTLLAGRTEVLPSILAAIVGATLARSVLLYLQTVATSRIVLEMTTGIQSRAFAHLIHADYDRLTREAPGQLVSRLTNDVVFVQQAGQAALNSAVRDSLSVIALVATMLYLDWGMTLIVLAIYPFAVLPIMLIGKRLRRVAKRTQAELGDMTAELTEKLSAARLIKTFRLEGYAQGRVERSFAQVLALRLRAVRGRARLDPMLEFLGGLAVAGVIALATWRIASKVATVGDFMGFISALLLAAQPIRALGNLSTKVQEGLAAAERIYDLIDEPARVVERDDARALSNPRGSIRFEGVSFAYPRTPAGAAAPDALNAVTLEVPAGRTVALVGPSGSGKSTLINLVPRLFDPTDGRILIGGEDVREATLASLREAVAIVSQDVTLFDDTIRANIALGHLGASAGSIEAAARAAAAHDFIQEQPQGYDTVIGARGERLSGGQRQRIALARAILRNAPILLLDEATSALDATSERLVQEALSSFARGRTTIVIAHRLSTVQNADLIVVLSGGRIIEQGRHLALLEQGGLYAELCRAQQLAGTDDGASPTSRS